MRGLLGTVLPQGEGKVRPASISNPDPGRRYFYLDRLFRTGNPVLSNDGKPERKLMKMAVKAGRETRPDLKCGICGEHGGEPRSIKFAHSIKLDYVSCSPYRIPVARIAAAQAAIEERRNKK